MSDILRDSFLALLKQGMTPLEALREFDKADWDKGLLAEIDSGCLSRNPDTFRIEAHDGLPSLLELSARAAREEMNEQDMQMAMELWLAGWQSETPLKSQKDIFSWFWRRPPRRPGGKGMKFWSTTMAYNHMMRNKPPQA